MNSSHILSLLSGIILTVSGTAILLIGFKVIGSKGAESEKMEIWHKKYGLLFKIGGVFTFIVGIINLFF